MNHLHILHFTLNVTDADFIEPGIKSVFLTIEANGSILASNISIVSTMRVSQEVGERPRLFSRNVSLCILTFCVSFIEGEHPRR